MALKNLLLSMLKDSFQHHPRYMDLLMSYNAFFVVFDDIVIVISAKGWTIYSWEVLKRVGRIGVEDLEEGISVGSSRLISDILAVRRKYDAVLKEYRRESRM